MTATPSKAQTHRRCTAEEGAGIRWRFAACLCAAIGIVAALGAAWLIWQAPHCRMVSAHAYYTPMERCAR
jgi:hypothetical protein